MSRRRGSRKDKDGLDDHEEVGALLRRPLLDDFDDEDAFEKVSSRAPDNPQGSGAHERSQAAAERHWQQNFGSVLLKWLSWFESLPRLLVVWLRQLGGFVAAGISGSQLQQQQDEPLPVLTDLQAARLSGLRARLSVPYDSSNEEHKEALRQLWTVAFPYKELKDLVSEQWKDMGWQGTDPSTDFRGGGFISLQNLLYFADKQPLHFQELLCKQNGKRAEWEYPFAVAGLNITFMMIELLDLRSESGIPSSRAGRKFLQLLEGDETAFDNLFCRAFRVLDAQWLAMGASYMEFNVVLRATRAHIEQGLADTNVKNVADIKVN